MFGNFRTRSLLEVTHLDETFGRLGLSSRQFRLQNTHGVGRTSGVDHLKINCSV